MPAHDLVGESVREAGGGAFGRVVDVVFRPLCEQRGWAAGLEPMAVIEVAPGLATRALKFSELRRSAEGGGITLACA